MRARETAKGWEGVKVVGFRRSQSTEEVAWLASPRSIFWGVALIVLGMLGGSLLLGAVSVNLVVAWLIVFGGMVHLITAHRAHRAGSLLWRLMIGFAHVFFGIYLIASPVLVVASLALMLSSLFLLESIFDIALFLRLRAIEGSNWVLLDGIVTLILGLMSYLLGYSARSGTNILKEISAKTIPADTPKERLTKHISPSRPAARRCGLAPTAHLASPL
jgi:uncharacterized membrane protein HdeD (DUF308 family)